MTQLKVQNFLTNDSHKEIETNFHSRISTKSHHKPVERQQKLLVHMGTGPYPILK